ncbi:lysM and putative peptidoglycan-binding domain-containing protein 4 [Morone saxatilis]|uniref:lysM and putative peptidoglycan-binding domain-containing protein 4 n=1 Tax=Morone saxatilis TaxID=34816 RepID=UPI0015E1E7E8|nr:lysM and putative peptidoglycan-binding domain-containing protein 4 [Morone saxatilis]XP_035521541.1 lysM and putative peptidoglycan-binding domain-containing protein 4 [Morone saxatilis]
MRRVEHVPGAFQAPVDVHASADGQVYMFKRRQNESTVSSDDEELTVMEMRPRVYQEPEQSALRNVQLLEREVFDGDSLNKLALQYGCKVADIKRVNNLMQEQDLFALKSIKIPVQKHSFLTETYTDLSDPQEEMPHSPSMPAKPQDRARAQPHLQEVTDFLMEVDHDIEKLIQTTNDQDEDFLDNSEKGHRFGFRGQRLTSHGADWGIQWWNAVVAMLLIGIVLPLFYVIYFKTKDNGVSPTDGTGAIQSSTISNTSGTGLGTLSINRIVHS